LEFIPFAFLLGKQLGYQIMIIFFLILTPISLYILIRELTNNEYVALAASFLSSFQLELGIEKILRNGTSPPIVAMPLSFLSLYFFLRYLHNKRFSFSLLLLFSALLAYTHLAILGITLLIFALILVFKFFSERNTKIDIKKSLFFSLFHILICLPLYYHLFSYLSFLNPSWFYPPERTILEHLILILRNLYLTVKLNGLLSLSVAFLAFFYLLAKEKETKSKLRYAIIFNLVFIFLLALKDVPRTTLFIERINTMFKPYLIATNLAFFMTLKLGKKYCIAWIIILSFIIVNQNKPPLAKIIRYQFKGSGLDWNIISQKLIQNGFAQIISPEGVRLKSEVRTIKNPISVVFQGDFSKLLPILQFPYIKTINNISEVDTKIESFISPGDFPLFENEAFHNPMRGSVSFEKVSPDHCLVYLQEGLGVKFFSQVGDDGQAFNNLRHMYIVDGTYMGQNLGPDNEADFIARLKNWGVNKACVWSNTAKRFFDKNSNFKPLGVSDRYKCYVATYEINPEVKLDKGGIGKITEETPFSFTVRLENVNERQIATINKNYFTTWSAYDSKNKRIVVRNCDQKICFEVAGNGPIYFKYQRTWLLNLIGLFTLLCVFVFDFIRRKRTNS